METVEDFRFVGALLRLSLSVQHAHTELAREHGTTPQQALMLCVVAEEPRGMAELAALLHIEKSTLTGLVDRAERRGLVRRIAATCDRRMTTIAITEAGLDLMNGFHEAIIKLLLDQLDELPPETRAQLRAAVPLAADVYWEQLGWSRMHEVLTMAPKPAP